MRRSLQIFAFSSLYAAIGCSPSPAPTTVREPAAQAATPEHWRTALAASFETLGPARTDADGVTKSIGCFGDPAVQRKCGTPVDVEYDSFTKSRLIMPGWSAISRITGETGVEPELVLLENERPVLVLRVQFAGDSWLFLERLSILIDDQEMMLDQPIDRGDRRTHALSGGVREHAPLIMKEAQFPNLRRIATAKKMLIRIAGEKGYVTVNPKSTARFRSDLAGALQVYEVLHASLPSPVRPRGS